MNNYLLSIDPSMKNTGFTLWENKIPILITSLNFSKKDYHYFTDFINMVFLQCQTNNLGVIDDKTDYSLYLVIERGIFNPKFGRGKETLDHLRGFIAGQFNKLLTKDMLISSSEWRKWYLKELRYDEDDLFKDKKWNKEKSLYIVRDLIRQQNWNITILNHDEAESLLIGWYYLNKEVK
ncbi:hypothetical protein [Spiroplasma endosymbiont of Nebria brevicollis]|uniref:hypothetical protein n=1 Tax=Spiroplasma endosymbiont of Nebria brevicollis TaxID=3066284 RepID=UPI00313DD25E